MDDCKICGGELNHIGNLGGLCWFRCRDCGMESHSVIQYDEMKDWSQDDENWYDDRDYDREDDERYY